MSPLVVDASAALKLVHEEPGGREVRSHLREALLGGVQLLVPPLFWLEIVNVLTSRYRYPPAAVVQAVYELEQVGLETADAGRPGILGVIDSVARTGLTAYDAAYLVLAESADASLLTADGLLASAAGERAIRIGGGHKVEEAPAPYATEAEWLGWEGVRTYLGELRRSLAET